MQDQSLVEAKDALSKLKLALQKLWPQIQANKMENSNYSGILVLGSIYMIATDSAKGLGWTAITNSEQLEIFTLRKDKIASFTVESLFKVCQFHYFLHVH